MPQLRCSVQTCVHNRQQLCSLDSIRVGGDHAKTAGDTCCDSFQERKGDGYSNAAKGTASPMTEIDCKAKECMYNNSCRCDAGQINVEGSRAKDPKNTACATFECGCR